MFDFQRLEIYKRSKNLNKIIYQKILKEPSTNQYYNAQLIRASISICANIAEGNAKFSKKDRKNFYTIARASLFECVAIIEIMKDSNQIEEKDFMEYLNDFEILSKMLFKIIRNLQ